MKHYDTNDRYTEQKKHKGKYKGDEIKIHNSLPQPEQQKILIVSTYDNGYCMSTIQIKNNKISIKNKVNTELDQLTTLSSSEDIIRNFKKSKFYKEFDKIIVIDNAFAFKVK